MKPNLTRHASKRLKERMGIKSQAEKERIANLALERGKFVKIEEREHRGVVAASVVLEYKDRLFVYSENKSLITVLPESKKSYETKKSLLQSIATKEFRSAVRLC